MKFVYLIISLAMLILSIVALTGLMPLLLFEQQSTSFAVLMGAVIILGLLYVFANPLLLIFERMIILTLLFAVFAVVILPILDSILAISLNMSFTTRAITTTILSVISIIYAIIAPG